MCQCLFNQFVPDVYYGVNVPRYGLSPYPILALPAAPPAFGYYAGFDPYMGGALYHSMAPYWIPSSLPARGEHRVGNCLMICQ